jgi:ubiquinone/menaquinone biosynthesis C-methylase UbiE
MQGFSDVDSANDPGYYLRYLAGVEQTLSMTQVRQRTYDALGSANGIGIDAGCGGGRAVSDLTARGLRAIGADASQTIIRSARLRFPRCPFVAADATRLPWASHSLGWYRSERMLLHVRDPAAALAEAARVLAPGSPIVLADQDLDTTVISSSKPDLTRQLAYAFTGSVANGHAGTRAGDYLADAAFTQIAVSVVPIVETSLTAALPLLIQPAIQAALAAGSVPEADLHDWLDEQRQRDQQGRFLLAMSVFVTTALHR